MAVEILIRRNFIAKKANEVAPLMVKLRSLALTQTGYISGESLRCIDPPGENEYLVRSTWRSAEDWKNWLNSEVRTGIQKQIDVITGEKTDYKIYEPLVGGIAPKYNE